jgi:hypothetical protein
VARITESELAQQLAVQVRIAALIRAAAARVEAPAHLRAALAEMYDKAGNPDRPPRP